MKFQADWKWNSISTCCNFCHLCTYRSIYSCILATICLHFKSTKRQLIWYLGQLIPVHTMRKTSSSLLLLVLLRLPRKLTRNFDHILTCRASVAQRQSLGLGIEMTRFETRLCHLVFHYTFIVIILSFHYMKFDFHRYSNNWEIYQNVKTYHRFPGLKLA